MDNYRPRHLVDFHVHAFPEKVVAKAVASLTAMFRLAPAAEPTIPGLLAAMDEAGVDVSILAPVATRPDQVRSINEWAVQTNSDRIICFGAFHPDVPDVAAEIDWIAGAGLKGVKCQPNFQQFVPDDRRMWPAYEAAQGRLVMLFHSGQEIACIEEVYARPSASARVRDAFPGLTMVLAHLGGFLMEGEVRKHILGREFYLDTSYCPVGPLDDQHTRELIRTHGVNRVLFATDFPWDTPSRNLTRLCQIGLEQEEIEAIAWENACDLLALSLT